eukprot:CAMPEP_0171165894 /NCGR_PEP_ID=MMETSP0790-20130122/6415_1 /TAXON_ID=2925 /ORGANISM="Alexandrium catenella, Strain OF101" /LENGTH=169 /DNA_ID=CAMNT_0011630687 /DNA_START=83 /DNA_END=590 /DNA_ORIENTATION=-
MAQIRGNWGDGISLFSGIVSVRQHKEQRVKKDEHEDLQAESVETDIKEVLAMKSSARLKWLQQALVLAGTGKMKTSLLYDIVKHPKFVAKSGTEFRSQLGETIQANLHLFSSKQQRVLLSEVKASIPPASARKGGGAAAAAGVARAGGAQAEGTAASSGSAAARAAAER